MSRSFTVYVLLQFEEPVYGDQIPDFTNFAAPGVILTWVHWTIVTVGQIFNTKLTLNAVDLTYCIVNECSPLLLYSVTLLASQQGLQIPTCFYRVSLFEEAFLHFPKLLHGLNDFVQSNGCYLAL